VISWFQAFAFKFNNLYRYITGAAAGGGGGGGTGDGGTGDGGGDGGGGGGGSGGGAIAGILAAVWDSWQICCTPSRSTDAAGAVQVESS
jgi:hypothetical protein